MQTSNWQLFWFGVPKIIPSFYSTIKMAQQLPKYQERMFMTFLCHWLSPCCWNWMVWPFEVSDGVFCILAESHFLFVATKCKTAFNDSSADIRNSKKYFQINKWGFMVKKKKKAESWGNILCSKPALDHRGRWQGNGDFIQLYGPTVIYTPLSSLISRVIFTFTHSIYISGGE